MNIVRLAACAKSTGPSATISEFGVRVDQSDLFEGRAHGNHRRARAWYEALPW